MSRSCHSATFSSAALGVAAQHAREARDLLALDRVALVGHRRGALLPGAERLLGLAHLGALEVADLGREPLESGAGERDRARAARRGGRARRPGWRRPRARGRAARARAPRTRGWSPRRCRRRPRARRPPPARRRAAGARRCGAASNAKPASLMPKVVGSACTPCVRPTQSVPACSRARAASVATSSRAPGDDHLAGGAQLQRERGVEHVRGGQAEVDPAARRPGRGGEHVHERGHVVVGDALALVDRLDREGRGADRLELLPRLGPASPSSAGQLLAGRDLDPPPGLHARLVGPEARRARGGCSGGSLPRIISGAAGGSRSSRADRADAESRLEL